jgi:hypothetical protein
MEFADKLKHTQDFLHALGSRPRDGRVKSAAVWPLNAPQIATLFYAYDLGNIPEGLA